MSGITHQQLNGLFRPRSMVLVGASERSYWTQGVQSNLEHYGYTGTVYAVNRSGMPVFGRPGFKSCVEIGAPVDVAYVSVPASGLVDAFEDIIAAGIRGAVVLTSGLAETGEEGAALQRRIVDMAQANGIAMFGPNSLGFVNVRAKSPVSGLGVVDGVKAGGVALLTQSGALASELLFAASRQDVGLSFYTSTGNEAMLGLADVIDFLVDDPETRVIGVCAEAIRKPEKLASAAKRALAVGKPIIVLKVGAGALAAEVAKAHTGSLVGDDRVFDAACEAYGLVRVHSIEQLLAAASLLDDPHPWLSKGVAFVSISGGACSLFADAAERYGVPMPKLAPQTVMELESLLPSFATVMNPLDITGGAVSDPSVFSRAIEIVGRDPNVGRVFSQIDIHDTTPDNRLSAMHRAVGDGLRSCEPPGIHLVTMQRDIGRDLKAYAAEIGFPRLVTGIEQTVNALGSVFSWVRRSEKAAAVSPGLPAASGARPQSETETLAYLTERCVGVVPFRMVANEAEAVDAAKAFDGPVALKIASADITHKSDVGGVRLDLRSEHDVAEAASSILKSVKGARPDARIDGLMVAPMRRGGVELIVGVKGDSEWGPLLLVGLGGVMVEVFKDTALRLLPASVAEVREMLEGLRGAPLLKGFRGTPAVDLDALAKEIVAIADAALALGPDLDMLEVNPLLARGDRIEALDALTIWKDAAHAG